MKLSLEKSAGIAFCAILAFVLSIPAQAPAPETRPPITRVGLEGLRNLLIPDSKPLVINFWATWCVPCREEFPDLVKIEAEYKGKIDLVTVSLDEVADLDTEVMQFLTSMKASMPAYLLDTPDADAAISEVSKNWAGNLPLTLVKAGDGTLVYFRNGKFRYEILKEQIDRSLGVPASGTGIISVVEFVKVKGGLRDEARYFYENNWRAYRAEAMKRGVIDSYEYIEVAASHDSAFDIILITRYKGEAQFKNSEKAFELIIKDLRPKGPLLKGAFKPNDIREIVHSYTARSIFPVR
jgi:thiol-disulfide isomerase/thioredoxin